MEPIAVDPRIAEVLARYNDRRGKEKLALVLNGGGLLGAHAFMKIYRLWEMGVFAYVEMIVGTSVGALNALLVGKYRDDLGPAFKQWKAINKNSDIYNGNISLPALLWDFVTGARSALYPKGLYDILDKHFCGMKLSDFPVEIITTATDMGIGICDGGIGNNSPMMTAIEHGATKLISIGTHPDISCGKMLVRQGGYNAVLAGKESSAIPVGFPVISEKPVKMVDVAKQLLPVIMSVFEEYMWSEKEWYDKLTTENPGKYPSVEMLSSYPEKDLGNMLDATWTGKRMNDGYAEACRHFTIEAIDRLLNT